jgi:hypothetical protein
MDAMTDDYWLGRGPHATPDEGRCAMEWVSYLAGEPHNDRPACVSPGLRSFCVALNDVLGNRERQRLRPYLTRTIGTVDDGLDPTRGWMALDWLVRVCAPAWLEVAGAGDAAHRLASQTPIASSSDLTSARHELDVARRDARTVRAGARRGSALAWALAPVRGRPSRKAARASARPAVWVVVRIAPGGDAGRHISDTARAICTDAATACDRAAIQATRRRLDESAYTLLDRMLPTESWSQTKMDGAPHVRSRTSFLAS